MLARAPTRWFKALTFAVFGLAAASMAVGLEGCTQSLAVASLQSNPIRTAIERGEMHSPKPAAMAFSSIEGAPDDVLARFRSGMTQEAGARDITISDPALARYFVRGYLDAFPTDQGTSVRFVWDVFDTDKRRVERLDDMLDLPKSDGDPWALVDDKVLASMAERSANSIATYLATTPEAAGPRPVAADATTSAGPAASAAAAAAAATKPLGAVN